MEKFKIGDRVVITKNNVWPQVHAGDVGVIIRVRNVCSVDIQKKVKGSDLTGIPLWRYEFKEYTLINRFIYTLKGLFRKWK